MATKVAKSTTVAKSTMETKVGGGRTYREANEYKHGYEMVDMI